MKARKPLNDNAKIPSEGKEQYLGIPMRLTFAITSNR